MGWGALATSAKVFGCCVAAGDRPADGPSFLVPVLSWALLGGFGRRGGALSEPRHRLQARPSAVLCCGQPASRKSCAAAGSRTFCRIVSLQPAAAEGGRAADGGLRSNLGQAAKASPTVGCHRRTIRRAIKRPCSTSTRSTSALALRARGFRLAALLPLARRPQPGFPGGRPAHRQPAKLSLTAASRRFSGESDDPPLN